MYYAIYIQQGRHWRMHNDKPTHNMKLAFKAFNNLKGYNKKPVMVISNTDPRHKDRGLRFVVRLTKNSDARQTTHTDR